jgi:hypothetical protein
MISALAATDIAMLHAGSPSADRSGVAQLPIRAIDQFAKSGDLPGSILAMHPFWITNQGIYLQNGPIKSWFVEFNRSRHGFIGSAATSR